MEVLFDSFHAAQRLISNSVYMQLHRANVAFTKQVLPGCLVLGGVDTEQFVRPLR